MMKRVALYILAIISMLAIPVRADEGRMEPVPDELKNIGVDEHLGSKLPLDLTFRDEHGRDVQLGKFFTGKKPVILQLGYYQCPMLCGLMSRGILNAVKEVSLDAGKDYDLVFVSIDPNESATLAAEKKRSFLEEYDRPASGDGWHFLTSDQRQIKALAQAVGFRYKWVATAQQFSHPAVLFICGPDGKISRCLYGVKFEPKTVRLSLVEASDGKIGTTIDQFVLTCFHYDGAQGKYAFAAISLMRLGGAITVIVIAIVLGRLIRREMKQQKLDGLTGHV